MIGTEAQDQFIGRSVIALLATVRAAGTPSTSMISVARRGDELFFSTSLDRWKGRSLVRDPRCALTVLNPHEPWSFVTVEGEVVIHADNPADLRQLILDTTDHPDYAWAREAIAPVLEAPGRAMFQLTPTRVSGVVMP